MMWSLMSHKPTCYEKAETMSSMMHTRGKNADVCVGGEAHEFSQEVNRETSQNTDTLYRWRTHTKSRNASR